MLCYICLLHFLGKYSFSKQFLNTICSGFDIEDAHSYIMWIDISSCPWASIVSNALMTLVIAYFKEAKNKMTNYQKCSFLKGKFFIYLCALNIRFNTVMPAYTTTSIRRPLIQDDQCWVRPSQSPYNRYCIRRPPVERDQRPLFLSPKWEKTCLKQRLKNFHFDYNYSITTF